MTRFQSVSYQRFAEGPARSEPEPAQLEALIAKARGRARADGFEEGVAHAETQRDAAQEETLRAIADGLAALAGAREEIQRQAAEATFSAIRDFIGAIAPRLHVSGAAEAAAEALSAAVGAVKPTDITVHVAEEALEKTRECLHAAGVRCAVKGDPAIPSGVARITGEGGFDEIDIRPAIETALEALNRAAAPRRARAPSPDASNDGSDPHPTDAPRVASTLFSEELSDE